LRRVGIDFHEVDGIFHVARTHVIESFSENIRISSDIHLVLFLEMPDLLRAFSATNDELVHMLTHQTSTLAIAHAARKIPV
jgi:hypothetical protein